MKNISRYIAERRYNLDSWIKEFTTDSYNADSLRFLDIRDNYNIIEAFSNLDECNKELYRSTYADYGNIWNTNIGDVCYEPVMSFSEDEDYVDDITWIHALHDYYDKKQYPLMKIILKPGSRSMNIEKYSYKPEQKEWLVCGKFKILNKEIKSRTVKFSDGDKITYKTHIVTIEQIFDESLEDIFIKLKM